MQFFTPLVCHAKVQYDGGCLWYTIPSKADDWHKSHIPKKITDLVTKECDYLSTLSHLSSYSMIQEESGSPPENYTKLLASYGERGTATKKYFFLPIHEVGYLGADLMMRGHPWRMFALWIFWMDSKSGCQGAVATSIKFACWVGLQWWECHDAATQLVIVIITALWLHIFVLYHLTDCLKRIYVYCVITLPWKGTHFLLFRNLIDHLI